MSAELKIHDNIGFENIRRNFFWYDHFWGDQIADPWNTSATGTGASSVVDGVNGGIARLSCPAADDSVTLSYGGFDIFYVDNEPVIEVKCRCNDVTDHEIWITLRSSSTNIIIFYKLHDSTTWNFYCRSGGVLTSGGGDTTVGTDWNTLRIKTSLDQVNFYVNGVEEPDSPITSNIPINALSPYIYNHAQADAVVEKTFDIDYVMVKQ